MLTSTTSVFVKFAEAVKVSVAGASLGNLAGIEESATLGMTARAAALAREGRSVVSLSAGEPDFDTPEFIREAGVRAIREGHTHYPPAAGLRPLREAIAAHVAEMDGVPCAPVNNYAEILSDEHVRATRLVREMTLPNGRATKTIAFPMAVSGHEFSVYRPSPLLGEHNDEVFEQWLKK